MEFAIWGVPPGQTEEVLLCAMPGGKPITTRREAEEIQQLLENKHRCTNCRIQTLDGTNPFGSESISKILTTKNRR